MQISWTLLPHQEEFVFDTTTEFLALAGGYGSGKSEAGGCKHVFNAIQHAGYEGLALAPTHVMAMTVLKPAIIRALDQTDMKWSWLGGESKFELHIPNKQNRPSTIWVRSAENYERLFGINAAWFGIDEVDLMPAHIADAAWKACLSRLRTGAPGKTLQGFVTSTPEGFRWMYQFFDEALRAHPKLRKKRNLIRAKTEDNIFLPPSYIENLKEQYPAHLLKAYMSGEFVNLTSGSVYPDYDADLNHTALTPATAYEAGVRILHVGLDFNVKEEVRHPYGIFASVGAQLGDTLHIVDEVYGFSRTVDLIAELKRRFGKFAMYVYPDASGSQNKTSASESDRAQLRQAGFIDRSPSGNPRVEDRVNAMNAAICSATGQRRLLINKDRCQVLARCLRQQPYDKVTGAPTKNTGLDDPPDSLGYMVNVLMPVKRRPAYATA